MIVDLFHGQLKSKVTCKVCGHESVRFDPFSILSLPLPMESSVHIEVIGKLLYYKWKLLYLIETLLCLFQSFVKTVAFLSSTV